MGGVEELLSSSSHPEWRNSRGLGGAALGGHSCSQSVLKGAGTKKDSVDGSLGRSLGQLLRRDVRETREKKKADGGKEEVREIAIGDAD